MREITQERKGVWYLLYLELMIHFWWQSYCQSWISALWNNPWAQHSLGLGGDKITSLLSESVNHCWSLACHLHSLDTQAALRRVSIGKRHQDLPNNVLLLSLIRTGTGQVCNGQFRDNNRNQRRLQLLVLSLVTWSCCGWSDCRLKALLTCGCRSLQLAQIILGRIKHVERF